VEVFLLVLTCLQDMAATFPIHLHDRLTDTPQMCADTLTFLTSERREWLANRYVSAQLPNRTSFFPGGMASPHRNVGAGANEAPRWTHAGAWTNSWRRRMKLSREIY
jgi:hypothetical protein